MCLLLIVSGVILAVFLLDYLFLKPKLGFPMPGFRLPLLGHMLFIGKKPTQKFEEWGKVYGPVYMIQVLNKTLLVVTDNEVFQQMCDNGNFEARNVSVRYNFLACAEKDGIPKDIFSQDATSNHQRVKHFTLALVEKIRQSSYFNELIVHTQNNMVQGICGNSEEAVIVDPYDTVTRMIYNYHMCAANGALMPVDNPTFQKMVRAVELIRIYMSTDEKTLETFPFLKYFGNSTYTGLEEVLSILTGVFRDLKAEVENNGVNQGLASGYLTDPTFPKEPEDVMTSQLVKDFVGAAEPAVTSFYGIILILAGHPEVQDKIRQEITSRKLPRPFVPAKDCRSPYIEAFLMESLRYMGPVPMVIRRAVQDTSLTGHHVPKDTNVIVNFYAGHHDASKYEDPWVFKPERFLGEDGNLLPESDPVRRNFKAYGGFKKQCLGVPVIKDVMFSLIAFLVDSFNISGVAGIDVPYDPRSWEGISLAAMPKRCEMKFTPRN